MATLEKIRSKGVLLLIVIGVSLLAFIIGLDNRTTSFFSKQTDQIAEINGTKVKIQDYQESIKQLTEVYKIEYGISSLDDNMNTQVRQGVWESLVKDNLIASETEKVGLAVSQKELEDITIGDNPHQLILGRRIFMNQNSGMFDKNQLIGFLAQLDKKPTNPEEQEVLNTYKSYWMYFENLIKTSKLEEKYVMLLSKALNATTLEAKMAYQSNRKVVDALYVVKPYTSVPDDKVKVSDEEIAAKYEQIKERYKQENNRDIKFVSFKLTPSAQDFAKAQEWINKLKGEFSTTSDIASVVNPNSKPYNDVALSQKDIDPDLKGFAFSAPKGAVFGPALFGNTYKMARVMETGISAPDSIYLKHIVVFANDEAKSKVLADSIMGALKGGADFAQLAMKYSKMEESARKGGDFGWLPVAATDPKIINACLAQPLNNYFTYNDGQAVQIISVTQKTANRSKVKLAVISSEVTPSQETYSAIYNTAKQFAGENNDLAKFEKSAQKKGLIVLPANAVAENAPQIFDIKNSREIIRWAFNEETKEGAISDVFDCENQFVVAANVAINEKGYKELSKVKEEVKALLIPDKKAALIQAELKGKNTADLQALALQLALRVDTAKQVNFDGSVFGNAGNEPEVIVRTSQMKLNEVSAPLKGKQGVFVVRAISVFDNPSPFDAKMGKLSLTMGYANAAYGYVDALKDKAEIEDNRSLFY